MSSFGGKTKTKSENNPWAPYSDYISGKEDGVAGIPESAYGLYQQGGFSPEMQGSNNMYTDYLKNSSTDPRNAGFRNAGYDLMSGGRDVANGAYDSNFNSVNNYSNFNPVDYVNMNSERAGMGALDPTQAFSKLLSGRPDTQYLDQQAGALTNNLTRNTNENVMPGLRSSAAISGQYGGSRQGIAEGLAASRLNQDLALPISQMYGNALEGAQNRMMGTSQYLNDNAYNTAFGNRNLGLQNNAQLMQKNQGNAEINFRNNQQLMDKNQGNLNNRMQSMGIAKGGFDLLSGMNDMQGGNYQNYINAMMMPQNMNWQNMNNYANLMHQGAGLGGTGKNTQSASPGIGSAILGTAATLGGIASGFRPGGGIK